MLSPAHIDAQIQIAKDLIQRGYDVEMEKTIDNHIIDIYAESETDVIIYEVIVTSDLISLSFLKKHINKPFRLFKAFPSGKNYFKKQICSSLIIYECQKCFHEWVPRTPNPVQCPKCKLRFKGVLEVKEKEK